MKARVLALVALVVLLVVLNPYSAPAQSATVTAGKAFKVVALHDGVDTVGYRVYVDGVKVGADVGAAALVGGSVTLDVPAIAAQGAHTIQVAAFNGGGEARSPALAFSVVPTVPNAPTGLRIIPCCG